MSRVIRVSLLILWVTFQGCGGSSEAGIDGNSNIFDNFKNGATAQSFKTSDFSPYIEFSEDNKLMRLKFSFFPDGTNFDFPGKRVIIPCDINNSVPEGVDVNLNAPIKPTCDQPFVLDVTQEGEYLNTEGLVLLVGEKIFSQNYGFEITLQGVKNNANDIILMAPKGKLEEYYALVKNTTIN
ncbi:MAG: hypothetical protein ACD_73C00540G0002 [uncultured bacterium]|nr:MAG: hypothetical protein ACD_73C00540G0002 [uncultured bacterium]